MNWECRSEMIWNTDFRPGRGKISCVPCQQITALKMCGSQNYGIRQAQSQLCPQGNGLLCEPRVNFYDMKTFEKSSNKHFIRSLHAPDHHLHPRYTTDYGCGKSGDCFSRFRNSIQVVYQNIAVENGFHVFHSERSLSSYASASTGLSRQIPKASFGQSARCSLRYSSRTLRIKLERLWCRFARRQSNARNCSSDISIIVLGIIKNPFILMTI